MGLHELAVALISNSILEKFHIVADFTSHHAAKHCWRLDKDC